MHAGKCTSLFLVLLGSLLLPEGPVMAQATLQLDFHQEPRGGAEGRVTPKLEVRHPEFGLVCELQCYETGPFEVGKGKKNPDGSVVFSYKNGDMSCTTTCTPVGADRVRLDVVIDGPADQIKKIGFIGPCMQHQRSPTFSRQRNLEEFASRSFLYTMRGPLFVPQTARGKLTSIPPDHPNNNPPCTQWFVPYDHAHWGSIWGAVGASGDRPIAGLVAIASHDGKWLSAFAGRYSSNMGQLYMDCIHVTPEPPRHFDTVAGNIRIPLMIYVMPNDPKKLFEAYLADFPRKPNLSLQAGPDGTLEVLPAAQPGSPLSVKLETAEAKLGAWQSNYWLTFTRSGANERMWAYAHEDAVELCVSRVADPAAANALVMSALSGKGWTAVPAPAGVPATVLRSADGTLVAALFWERSQADKPGSAVPAAHDGDKDSVSVRGRLVVLKGDASQLSGLWSTAVYDWKNSVPYLMPARDTDRR